MYRQNFSLFVLLLVAACGGSDPHQVPAPTKPADTPQPAAGAIAPRSGAGATAYTNANVWDGTGSATMQNAYLLVRDGRIESAGSGKSPAGAEIVDLQGSWIVPGFVNAHAHVSGLWAADDIDDPAQRIKGTLVLYAQYGVTTLLSLGDSAEPQLAAAATNERTSPDLDYARAYIAGTTVADNDPAIATQTAMANVALGVDFMKLRIDDNLGSQEKMPPEAARAAITVAQQNDIPVATHIFYLDDAAMVLNMGSNLIAHSVRDQKVTDEFLETIRQTAACYVPTLVREVSTFVYAERPAFFDDSFFLRHAKRSEMSRVTEAENMARIAESDLPATYRAALTQAQENLRILSNAGIPIAFGTDSGPAGRFPGYFEHMEFALMAEAGMQPRNILLSATSVAADCLGLDDVGTLVPGKWADFVVLAEDPLQDINATRSLTAVYVAGNKVTD